MDMRTVNSQIEAGWAEEPVNDVFLRTAARLNFAPSELDAHAFVHGLFYDRNAPVHHAENFDPKNIWESLLFSFASAEAASTDFQSKVQAAWDVEDDNVRETLCRTLAEEHVKDAAELVRVRDDAVFLKTETAVIAFTREGEIVGSCWEGFHSRGNDTSLFVLPEHRGKGIGLDLVELAAVHRGLSHWFKSEEDLVVNTLAGTRVIEACYRRIAETYGVFPERPDETLTL